MLGMKVVSEKAISNVEARQYLETMEKQYKEKEKEIGYELEQSLRYTKKFSRINKTELKKMTSDLENLKLPDKVVIELLNIRPNTDEKVKAILFKKTDINEDIVKKIIAILK